MANAPAAYERRTINAYSELSAKQRTELEAGRLLQQKAAPTAAPTPQKGAQYRGLGIGGGVQASKLADKHVALSNPAGKTSDLRAQRQKIKVAEKQKRQRAKIRGNKSRGLLPKPARQRGLAVPWSTALSLHKLWLGYMSDLLGVELDGSALPPTPQEVEEELLPTQPQASTSAQMQVDEPAQAPAEEPVPTEVQMSMPQDQGFSVATAASWQLKLSKADFHGCLITVKHGSNPSMVGMTGIIVQETAGTWSISTPDDKIKVLPKAPCTFTIALPLKPRQQGETRRLHFDLAGSQFAHRAADRVQRKLKASIKPAFEPEGLQLLHQ